VTTVAHAASARSASGTVLALDFGLRRTGVAVGEMALGIAHPLKLVDTADPELRLTRVADYVQEWQPTLFVLGWPVRDDGAEHPMAAAVQAFQAALEARFGLPVERVDERFSSHAASQSLGDAGVRGRRQKAHLDSVAASEILQGFFDAYIADSA
jgi:putative Holliday junction resolvase